MSETKQTAASVFELWSNNNDNEKRKPKQPSWLDILPDFRKLLNSNSNNNNYHYNPHYQYYLQSKINSNTTQLNIKENSEILPEDIALASNWAVSRKSLEAKNITEICINLHY